MTTLVTSIKRYWISITVFLLTVITILSLLPLQELPPVPGGDKTHHFIAYAMLILPTALKKPKHGVIICLFFIGWSGGIELLQPYVNRYGEFQDLAANITGLVCGLLVAKLINWLIPDNSIT